MARSLRLRIQLWHAVILTVVVIVFGTLHYRQLHRSTMEEIDGDLLSTARALEGTLRALPPREAERMIAEMPLMAPPDVSPRFRPPGPGNHPFSPDHPRPNPPPPRPQPYFAIVSASGQVLRKEPPHALIESTVVSAPMTYRSVQERRELILRGPFGVTIVVGRDIRPQLNRLRDTLFGLIALGFAVLSLGLIGGWWMSGRAIRPIGRISEIAARINASTLDERIDSSQMDTELQSLTVTLNSMLERLQHSFARQSQFTADASHELRTPIAVLLSQCELSLKRTRTPEEYVQAISACDRAAKRMKSLVEGLLTLARADAGKLELAMAPVDLYAVASEAIELLTPFAAERSVTLSLEGESTVCNADANRIAQVVTNLVQNAIMYNSLQGTVTVTLQNSADYAQLEVIDTGVGIPPESIPHLFDRFYRVDTSRSRPTGGSGLGLAISKSIVDAHGGALDVKSELGKGSTFTLRIPFEPGPPTNEPGSTVAEEAI